MTHLYSMNDSSMGGNRICDVMVSVLVSSAVDRRFEPRSYQTKSYTFCICYFTAKDAALWRKRLVGSELE